MSWSISASRSNSGQTLAIIGATGSGKTTLVSLIPRFYDATSGQVSWSTGVDVREYTASTRCTTSLGYVTQKAVLFSGTVEDNVFFGQSKAAARRTRRCKPRFPCRRLRNSWTNYPEKARSIRIAQLGRERLRRAEAAAFHRACAGTERRKF